MKDPGHVLILGAGPTGLGAAYRLQELGFADFTVLEAKDRPGGLATSYEDDRGFTWDVGGHVHFSHYGYYDRLFRRVMQDRLVHHERQSWIWLKGRFVPYPFQYNLHRLDRDDQDWTLQGLEEAVAQRGGSPPPENFRQWIEVTFGIGISELFMRPYNRKVWGYPLDVLSAGWIAERVAVPELDRVLRSLTQKQDDVSWGPNRRFLYPLRGGTGAVWDGVSDLIDNQRLRFGARAVGVDLKRREVRVEDGRTFSYDTLITSLPLDLFCPLCDSLSAEVCRAADELMYSSVHLVGVGLRGAQPSSLKGKCWMYFPEWSSPYYRVTVLSNYSRHNVPEGEDYWSLLAEVCETPHKPVEARDLPGNVVEAMRRDALLAPTSEVVSLWHHREEHGYPTPFYDRDEILAQILPHLERHRIYSRGRFGAWKYEVSNQDHTFMQGVEVVDRILGEGEETTLYDPSTINRPRERRSRQPAGAERRRASRLS